MTPQEKLIAYEEAVREMKEYIMSYVYVKVNPGLNFQDTNLIQPLREFLIDPRLTIKNFNKILKKHGIKLDD